MKVRRTVARLTLLCLSATFLVTGLSTAGTAEKGSISGRVTTMMGKALPDMCVSISTTNDWEPPSAEARTDYRGFYSASGLDAGDYLALFHDCGTNTFISEWYGNARDFELATMVHVNEGMDTPSIDAALARPSSISGKLVDSSEKPLAGICVDAIDTSQYDRSGGEPRTGVTDRAGHYVITGLRTSQYKVRFFSIRCHGDEYVDDWYAGKTTRETADLIPVGEEKDVKGINGILTLGGYIEGTLTNKATGAPATKTCVRVEAYPSFEGGHGSARTDETGHYKVQGLRPGNYKVQFGCFGGEYVGEWFDDKPDRQSATPISVESGKVTFANASLESGSIEGKVVADDGSPFIGRVCIDAYNSAGLRVGAAATDPTGSFRLKALRDGAIRLQARDCYTFSNHYYSDEYYNNKTSLATADSIWIVAGKAPFITISLAPTGYETTPPETTIEGPTGPVNRAYFGVRANENSLFYCSMDGADYSHCGSTLPSLGTYQGGFGGLAEGWHTFRAYAVDRWGNTDPTPAEWSFLVDVTPPTATVTSGPAPYVSETSSTFEFESNEELWFAICSVDGKWSLCSSPFTTEALAPGHHSFMLRVFDIAGNTTLVQEWNWTIDVTAPSTSISSGWWLEGTSAQGLVGGNYSIAQSRVSAQAEDPDSPITTATFKVDGVAVDPAKVSYDAETKTWSFDFKPPATRDYVITFEATNAAGLVGSSSTLVHGIGPGV